MDERLIEIARQHDGLLWERPGRYPAVTDRFGCRVFRLPPEAELMEVACLEKTRSQLEEFFSNLKDTALKPRQEFQIHLLREELSSVGCRAAVDLLAEAFCDYYVNLVVHFSDPTEDWADILAWSEALWQRQGKRPRDVWITLEGPLGSVSEEAKEGFHDRAFQFYYTQGLADESSKADEDAAKNLRDLAKFGFLIPTAHYVTEESIGALDEALEQDLRNNLSSGFSLPLACQHPRYERKDLQRLPLPAPTAYIRLLADMVTKHPTFDALFRPVSDLNSIVASGGWNERLGIPSQVGLIVRGNGTADVFRQVPMMARPWTDASQILSSDPNAIHDKLIDFCSRELSPEAHQPCADCSLRFMCGGMDAPGRDQTEEMAEVRELICRTRRFFLEAFLWQRIKAEEVAAQESAEVEAVG